MFYVREIQTTAPAKFKTPLQKIVYKTLEKLNIFFERVDTDEDISRVSFAPAEKMDTKSGAGLRRGTGEMRTRLQAASLAMSQGINTIITNGKNLHFLYDIASGKSVRTVFVRRCRL